MQQKTKEKKCLLCFTSVLICCSDFCCASVCCSWAPWVPQCWTRSQRRCGSTSKCCSVSHPMSDQMQTRWPRFASIHWRCRLKHSFSCDGVCNIFFLCVFQIPFFDDVGAVTLQYFDSLFQRDNLQKSQFYKGLPKVLPKLPKVGQAKLSSMSHTLK